MQTNNIIGFGNHPTEFNPNDFKLLKPQTQTISKDNNTTSTTSLLQYKGQECQILLPEIFGYGLTAFKDPTNPKKKNYSFSYLKPNPKDKVDPEERLTIERFLQFMQQLEDWLVAEILKFKTDPKLAPYGPELEKRKIKPFFISPKEGSANETPRMYIKCPLSCKIKDEKGAILRPQDLASKPKETKDDEEQQPVDFKKGHFNNLVHVKGVYFSGRPKSIMLANPLVNMVAMRYKKAESADIFKVLEYQGQIKPVPFPQDEEESGLEDEEVITASD
jgi:hypothetical protein